jgi:hypothetical protein
LEEIGRIGNFNRSFEESQKYIWKGYNESVKRQIRSGYIESMELQESE